MSTIDFKAVKDQAHSIMRRFENASSYLELSTLRIKSLSDYIEKIKSEYSNHAKNLPDLKLANFKKYTPEANQKRPLAPGLPGCHTDQLDNLGSTTSQVAQEFNTFSKFINENILQPLLDYKLNSEEKLKAIMDGYYEYKSYRKKCKNDVKSSLKDFNSAASAAEKAYKEFTSLQKSNKADKLAKATNTLRECCENYQKKASLLRINVGKFNTAHENFIDYCEVSIDRINELHPKRVEIISNMVHESLAPSLGSFANWYRDAQSIFERSAVQWEPDFKTFVDLTGLSRTLMKPEGFATHDGIIYAPKITQLDAPILIAKVIKDYSSSEPFKMSIKAGDIIGIYDNLSHDWVLARDPYGQKRYVPSACLTVEPSKIALVRAPQISTKPELLQVTTGELLYIIEENEQECLCMNLKQQQGLVAKYALFVENQE